ncbi:MAG: flavodoxin family protein [Ruminococcaceae bacterium]|nr:flavodoxin family protein [Oscillospiraceae bacterium]
MKVLMLNGSPNIEGNIHFLLSCIADILNKNAVDTQIINVQEALLSAKVPFCVCCSNPCNKSCYEGTFLEETLEKMAEADCIVFGSPVYFGSMSGQLKCLFDKTRVLRGKKALIGKLGCAVVCGASKFGGQETTIRAIHDAMLVDGMTIIGASSQEIGAGHLGVSAVRPAKDDENAISRAELLAHRILEELR